MCPLQLASSRKPLYIHPPVTQAWVLRFSKTRRFDALHRATARMAKLVDAWDLKSPVRKDVPVRFRLRAPNKSRACMRFFMQALCFLFRNFSFLPLPLRTAKALKFKTSQPQPNL